MSAVRTSVRDDTPRQLYNQSLLPRAVRRSHHPLDISSHRGQHDPVDSESEDEDEDEDMTESQEHEQQVFSSGESLVNNERNHGLPSDYNQRERPWQSIPWEQHQQQLQRQRIWRHPQQHPLSTPPLSQPQVHISVQNSRGSMSSAPDQQAPTTLQPYNSARPRFDQQHSLPQQQPQQQSSNINQQEPQEDHVQRPAFLSQPVYQLACRACIRPLCLRAMKAVMLSDHSKELYSTDMPPSGLSLVNEDRQVRHCACRIRDSACLGW